MDNLIQLAGRLVCCEDDVPHQPLRCEAAAALRDASTELLRLRGVVEKLQGELAFYGHNPNRLTTANVATAAGVKQ